MATSQGPIDFASFEQRISESRHNGVNIVVVGVTGAGKSTFINGLVGADAMPEGHGLSLGTWRVTEYTRRGIVRIFDTPGFFNGDSLTDDSIVQEIADKTKGKIDLLVYCHSMTNRIGEQTKGGIGYIADILCLRHTRTPSFIWENVLYVFTCANYFNVKSSMKRLAMKGQYKPRGQEGQEVRSQFEERYEKLRQTILHLTQQVIQERNPESTNAAAIASDIPVVAAGVCTTAIPGSDDWLSHLWRVAYSRVDTAADAAHITEGTRPIWQRIGEAIWGEEALQTRLEIVERERRYAQRWVNELQTQLAQSEKRVKEAMKGREEERRDAQHRVDEAEQRAMDLETQLARSEETREEAERRTKVAERRVGVAEHRVVEVERRMQELQNDLAEAERGRRAAEEGREAAEDGREAADRRAGEAEARTALAEEEMTELETRFAHAEKGRTVAERRAREMVQRAEEQANEAERGRREAEGGREEAERGREEAERRADQVENERIQAEQQRREAERGRREAVERAESWVVRREEIQLTAETLGEGGWGVVKVAEFRGLRVAAKCLHELIISNYNRRLFTREMNVAARIRHPNLLLLVGATIHEKLIILTELMPTSLRAILERGPLTPAQCLSISLDVAAALNYLHLMRPDPIIHRDISSANVLLEPTPNDSWKAKVSDYGTANFLQQLKTANPGNPVYCAPEASDPACQSAKMDIFSFGVLLVEVYTATFPAPSDREDLIQSIRDDRVVRLIRQCMSEDMTRRPSAAEVITQLRQLQPRLDHTPSTPETVHEQHCR